MDLLFIVYAALFLIGVWYAFRSGQLHERARRDRERKAFLTRWLEENEQ